MNTFAIICSLTLLLSHASAAKEKSVKRRGILYNNDLYNQYQLVQVPQNVNLEQVLQQSNTAAHQYSEPINQQLQPNKEQEWAAYQQYYQRAQFPSSTQAPFYTEPPVVETTTAVPVTTQAPAKTYRITSTAQQLANNQPTVYYIIANGPLHQQNQQATNAQRYVYAVPLNVQHGTTEQPESAEKVTVGAQRFSRYSAGLQNAGCNLNNDPYKK